MGYTFREAFSLIGTEGYDDVQGLRRLLQQTSAVPINAVPGAQALLYSGSVEGIPAWEIAERISNQSSSPKGKEIVTITDTAAGNLLQDPGFRDALRVACERENLEFKLILDGENAAGERVGTGLWDDASKNFANSVKGNVCTIVGQKEHSCWNGLKH